MGESNEREEITQWTEQYQNTGSTYIQTQDAKKSSRIIQILLNSTEMELGTHLRMDILANRT